MALTFKKRDDLDKVLGDLAALPPEVTFSDIEKIEKNSDKKIKSPEDFLKTVAKPTVVPEKPADVQ
ncbi:MAG: hypothetical protein LBS41_00365 [Streptococcaceae bacterium]|jgi:hypothetical protein|nr:hypothetical protein [Streptococcaceae bacterium]